MGTRAVVHTDLRPAGIGKDIWIATHWDGDPASLGSDLRREIILQKKKWKKDYSTLKPNMGSIIQEAVVRASAGHSIDEMSTSGKSNFNYGDFAEYEYEIDAKTGKIKVRERMGQWSENKAKKWKQLSKIL